MKPLLPLTRWVWRRGGLWAAGAVLVVFAVSGFYAIDVAVTRNERFAFAGGNCNVKWRAVPSPDPQKHAFGAGIHLNEFGRGNWKSFPFSYGRLPEHHFIWFPMWAPGMVVLAWGAAGSLWRPRTPNHCRSCGYDQSGSPGATCPECGRAW